MPTRVQRVLIAVALALLSTSVALADPGDVGPQIARGDFSFAKALSEEFAQSKLVVPVAAIGAIGIAYAVLRKPRVRG